MTREEIMQMGRQAGSFIELAQEKDLLWLERFAKLVAQHEREACAKLCEEMRTYVGRNNAVTQSSAQDCATAIRARGQA
jgi:hypothetical protein